MKRLKSELGRLFRASDNAADSIGLVNHDGLVTTLVVTIARSRDWPVVAGLLDGLRENLDLPLPAVSVSGAAGFQLWLPLAEPVARETAAGFLLALRRQFLADIDDKDLGLLPLADGPDRLPGIPAWSAESDRWSAFIDPSMGGMFAEGGGLDFEPNPDRQADLLAAIRPIELDDFKRALAVMTVSERQETGPVAPATPTILGGGYSEPRDFLLAVMNEPSVPLPMRIDAAKALLGHERRWAIE